MVFCQLHLLWHKIPGAPRSIGDKDLDKSMASAKRTTSQMKSRHGATFGSRLLADAILDPDKGESEEDSGEFQLWRLLPQLKEVPEEYLRKLPLSAMFQLNNSLAKEKKSTERLGINSRLARNALKQAQNPVTVERISFTLLGSWAVPAAP